MQTEGSQTEGKFVKSLIQGSKSEVTFWENEDPEVQLASVMYNATTDDEEHLTDESDTNINTDIAETTSKTTEQRPDIVLRLSKKEDAILYTYLFDAKYRIRDTTIPSHNGVEVPPVDAINQMHRYRDAIYYTHSNDEQLKREVIGGYVLYPGNLTKEQFENSYYWRSVDEVNIGAFPLKPGGHWHSMYREDGGFNELLLDPTASEDVLYRQIETWLRDENPLQTLIEKAIPQKGLEYVEQGGGKGPYFLSSIDTHVNKNVDEIANGTATCFISGYSTLLAGIDFSQIKYFAAIIDHKVAGYYKVNSYSVYNASEQLEEEKATGEKRYQGYNKPYRVRIELGEYIALASTFIYGLDRNAAKGVTMSARSFKNYCGRRKDG